MKKSVLSLVLLSTLSLAATARASYDLGGGATLFPIGTASAQYNDNIFLSSGNEKSDTVLDLAPGLQLLVGQPGLNRAQLSYTEDFQFYSSESDLNTALAKVDFLGRYDDGKMKLDADAWFHQANQATRDIRGAGFLVRRDLVHAGVLDETVLTEKTSLSAGVAYDETNYKPAGYVSWKYVELPFKYYYKIEPKFDLSAGFRYRDNKLDASGVDSTEYFYSVGARGELAPLIVGEISVGLDQRRLARGGDRNGLGVDANFTYDYSPKTKITFGGNNQYGYSSTGTPYTNFGLHGGVNVALSNELSLGGQIYYDKYSYTGAQKDDFYQGQLSANYLVNAYLTVSGAYSYAKDESNLAGASFKNNIFGVSATFRY